MAYHCSQPSNSERHHHPIINYLKQTRVKKPQIQKGYQVVIITKLYKQEGQNKKIKQKKTTLCNPTSQVR